MLALLWETHDFHERVTRWQENQSLAVCPITELGFLRISAQPSFGLSPAEARRVLNEWKRVRKPVFVACDLAPLDGDEPPSSGQTTDFIWRLWLKSTAWFGRRWMAGSSTGPRFLFRRQALKCRLRVNKLEPI